MKQVSVIVPCRNERRYIEAFCAGVMRQQMPPGWQLQLVVADGQSDDGTRELRMLGEKGSHEQAAVAAAFDGEFVSACVAALDEVISTGGEVIKDVLLLRQIACEMPFLTVFTSAANVGDDVDAAAVKP